MELLQLIKYRRSIRKYQDKQIPADALEQIIQAGLFAPNAGGGQRRYVVAMHDKALCERVGRLNAGCMNRKNLAGSYVSVEQPSLIDDPTIKSGFYGAPTVCAIFGQENFLYSVPDAFCCAQNMTLMAAELGIASCIVARGEQTFQGEYAQSLLEKWQVPEGYVARCFVLLGYCDGPYPAEKPRKENAYRIVEE